ncbi:hypothetical protein DNTS_000612 [Danionella cerebrum]|uniref:OCA domain-containing protein n=1 Tax=Danionella cerebrum TaxID=2873325 RepID=A0A553R7X4_9TELE|nr:hypothetical protein DNTS_000612 [Danionella translucida]
MVSSRQGNAGRKILGLNKDTKNIEYSCGLSPMEATLPSNTDEENTSSSTLNHSMESKTKKCILKGSKKHKTASEKKYLGVRVRMPVRDMLQNIRIANGIDPLQKKSQTKGLEDLAIIVEVLEEDLKTCQMHTPPHQSPSGSTKLLVEDSSQQGHMNTYCQENEMFSPCSSLPSDVSPVRSVYSPYQSPAGSHGGDVFFANQEEYSGYESEKYVYDDFNDVSNSPVNVWEFQVPSPQEYVHARPNTEICVASYENVSNAPWLHCQDEQDALTFFRAQMEREENLLKEISDQELLAVDGNGRIVVEEGKRSLVYVVARRMAALKKLDAKDSDGKTPLHLAAQKNQHFIVADLVSLGANINMKDRYGKTCLHLSAENGYIRVLEVLKSLLKSGVYINLEERDANGLSALQCAAVALKQTVCELELSHFSGQLRLHNLRREQMKETLECLLQMESYLHALADNYYLI